jgi:AcrR family transcriptional regulator
LVVARQQLSGACGILQAMGRTRDELARRRVLNSTRDLIQALGPRAVTVQQIAAEAGVGRQTIYRWWPSKSAVIVDALVELTDPMPNELPDSTYEAIRVQMHRVVKMFSSRNGELIRELVADSQGDPAIAKEFRERFFDHRRAWGVATLDRGVMTGELRSDLDFDCALDSLYAPLWLRLLIGHAPITRSAADEILRLAWPGLAGRSAGVDQLHGRPRAGAVRRSHRPRVERSS